MVVTLVNWNCKSLDYQSAMSQLRAVSHENAVGWSVGQECGSELDCRHSTIVRLPAMQGQSVPFLVELSVNNILMTILGRSSEGRSMTE